MITYHDLMEEEIKAKIKRFQSQKRREDMYVTVDLFNFLHQLEVRNIPRYSLWEDSFTYKSNKITVPQIVEEPADEYY